MVIKPVKLKFIEEKLISTIVTMDDLKELCDILEVVANDAAELDTTQIQRKDETDIDFELRENRAKDAVREIVITVTGYNNERITMYGKDIFQPENVPNLIKSVEFDNVTSFSAQSSGNGFPSNHFRLFLDF